MKTALPRVPGLSLAVLVRFPALLFLVCFSPAAIQAQSLTLSGGGSSVDFGTANICARNQTTPAPCTRAMTLTYTITASGTLSPPHALTMGMQFMDFTIASGSTCSGAVLAGNTCVVKVSFAPKLPGARHGTVVLRDGSGNTLTTTFVYGTGTGPQIAFDPSPQSILNLAAVRPVVDGNGNLFAINESQSSVDELAGAEGIFVGQLGGYGYFFDQAVGMAIDPAANVFVTAHGGLYESLAASGYTTVVQLPPDYAEGQLGALAADRDGDLFTSINGVTSEILAAGGYTTVKPLNTARYFQNPVYFALDGNSNLFAAASSADGSGTYGVYELPAAGGYSTVKTVFLTTGIFGLAVDPLGNLYVGDDSGDIVRELLAADGYATVKDLNSGFVEPDGLAVDGSGNVYVGSAYSGIAYLNRSQPHGLSFRTTPPGDISSDSPRSIEIENIGNATLTGSQILVPVPSLDFTEAPGPGTPPDCGSNFSIGANHSCNLSFNFHPATDGSKSAESPVFSDSLLNGLEVSRTIQLTGAGGTPATAKVSPNPLQFSTTAIGSSETLPLTITNVGTLPLTASLATISGPSYTVADSSCGGQIAGGNSCTMHVNFAPVGVGSRDDVLTLVTNTSINPTVGLQGVGAGVSALSLTLSFPTLALGAKAVLPLNIQNVGIPGAQTVSFSGYGPSYKIVPGSSCVAAGVAPGQTCTVQVEFEPVGVGDRYSSLTVTSSNGSVTRVVLVGSARGVSRSPRA